MAVDDDGGLRPTITLTDSPPARARHPRTLHFARADPGQNQSRRGAGEDVQLHEKITCRPA